MLKKLYHSCFSYLLNFLELQLVITLLSLPILICWGIPISSMFLISNLIFTPLLILILWISALFALCVIIGIPCNWLTFTLKNITYFWNWLASFSTPTWLIGFSCHMFIFCLIVCCLIIVWYSLKKFNTAQSVLFLASCFTVLVCTKNYYNQPIIHQVGSLNMIALRLAGKNYLFDYGALCSKQNFYTNIDYNIIPELIKHTGMTTIDTLILCKPSKRLAQVAWQFAQQTNVATILIPKKFFCYKTLHMINQQEHQNKNILPIL